MVSETPRLNALAAGLVAELAAVVPAAWAIRDAEARTDRALGVVLYYEQGDIVTRINGGPVPVGFVGVEFSLTLAAPEEDPQLGTARVTTALLDLLPALDGVQLLFWDRADKFRTPTGETCYRVPVVHLADYTPTDPATVPDNMPEEA